ncbi:uncharacterized protein NPIL_50091 [Nephila pilipes]|uniref:Uncharacterized protein n=1 Tax=Nephila pilipes TaxID=299642 RepID=A0A8X6TKH9_NEPPI|nr:uncharacterized protein NPIL_50091 [Nephila pilipes]
MHHFKKKGEKYELNPPEKQKETYGACRKAGEDEDYILSRDELEEEAESLSNDCGIVMPPVPKCDKYTFFRDGKRKIGNISQTPKFNENLYYRE